MLDTVNMTVIMVDRNLRVDIASLRDLNGGSEATFKLMNSYSQTAETLTKIVPQVFQPCPLL